MDGVEEFARYRGDTDVSRDEWMQRLSEPPLTTAQVCEVVVKVDTAGTGLSYAEMLVARSGRARGGDVSDTDRVTKRSSDTAGSGQSSGGDGGGSAPFSDVESTDVTGAVRSTTSKNDACDVGRPTIFLSHAWRFGFAGLVSAVEAYLEECGDKVRDGKRFTHHCLALVWPRQVRRGELFSV